MRAKPPTLEDVARHARVSKMTVSLCLRSDNGAGRASRDTRERVMRAVEELGYRPNLQARSLRLGRSNVIAFYAGHGFVNVRIPFFAEIVSGLQEACEITKKDLLLHGTFHGSKNEDIFGELRDGRIEGLVVNVEAEDPLVPLLKESGFAFVAVADEIKGVPSVLVDDVGGMEMIVRHLYDQGHRKIVFAQTLLRIASSGTRHRTCIEVAASLGMSCEVVSCDDSSWDAVIPEVLVSEASAIVCWSDTLAREIVDLLLGMGVDVPGKVAVTGFDGCPTPYREALPLTTIAAPWCEVAKAAALYLDAVIRGEMPDSRIVMPVRFVRGASS